MIQLSSFLVILIATGALRCYAASQQRLRRTQIPCNQCGYYCSKGKVSGYSGDISTGDKLRNALEGNSYKREVIFTIVTSSSFNADLWGQLHNDVVQLCYDHFVILSINGEQCAIITHSSPQHVNCIWDSTDVAEGVGGQLEWTWHLKHRFIARTIRLGYNVLYLDADTVVVNDLYRHVKAPGPLAHVQLLTAQELPCGIQASFFYVQNVAPDGPVAWLFHDATEQPLRWLDEKAVTLIGWGKQRANERLCMTFDQAYLDDALKSTVLGQVVRWRAVDACMADDWAPGNKQATPDQAAGFWRKQILLNFDKATDCPGRHMKETFIDHPAKTIDQNKLMRTLHLVIPQGTYMPQVEGASLDGWRYTQLRTTPGPLVDAYRRQLREDCPTCPMLRDPLTSGVAGMLQQAMGVLPAHRRNETFAFAPRWFVGTTREGGFHGAYTSPNGTIRAVLIHMHRFHDLPSTGWAMKVGIRKHFGMFNSSVSRALRQPKSGQRSPWGMGHKPGKLLVLHPDVQVASTSSYQEYIQLVISLVQAALLLGRTPVMPDVPCNTHWMHPQDHRPEQMCAPPIHPTHTNVVPYMFPPAFVHGATPEGGRVMRLAVGELLEDSCRVSWGGTLNEPEWAHWQVLHDVRPGGHGDKLRPGGQNVVLPRSQLLEAATRVQRGMLFIGVSAEAVLKSVTPAQHGEPVLYLGHPVFMDLRHAKNGIGHNLTQVYEEGARECQGVWSSLEHNWHSPDWKLMATRVDKQGEVQATGQLSI